MRNIGQLPREQDARAFGDFLLTQGVDNQVDAEPDGSWSVWVHSEEHLDRAKRLLEQFGADPNDAQFTSGAREAQKIREQRRADNETAAKRVRHARSLFPSNLLRAGPVSLLLIAISIGVFVLTNLGRDWASQPSMFISLNVNYHWNFIESWRALTEIRSGEVWRFFTPIFLHGGGPDIFRNLLHIGFNCLNLYYMGSIIESKTNSFYFLLQVLVLAALSNFGQFVDHGPAFGGLSGVVYGTFGYLWIRGKFDRAFGDYLGPTVVMQMLVWFVLCYSGGVGRIANTAHAVGLIGGMAWGWIDAMRHR
jgi:GlpG protein